MRIGFEAKRAFHNFTGLGNYSRQVIQDLNEFYFDNDFFLYTTRVEKNENPLFRLFRDYPNSHLITPSGWKAKISEDLWRRSLGSLADKDKLDIFHGLSNELPVGFKNTNCKKVVTIHDVIFKRYPEWYKKVDRKIYDRKTKQACDLADKIIAISNQTKQDLIEFYQVDESKIEVVYQACNPIFYDNENVPFRNEIISKYKLDKPFMLYVGSLTARKNVFEIIYAYEKIMSKTDHDLILIGNGKQKDAIENYIFDNDLDQRIRLYNNFPTSDLPPMYQLATLTLYPSTFEGFGIPIIESLWSKTPVITNSGSCFKETAGEGAIYLNQVNKDTLSNTMIQLLEDSHLQNELANAGFEHVQQFERKQCIQALWKVFQKVL